MWQDLTISYKLKFNRARSCFNGKNRFLGWLPWSSFNLGKVVHCFVFDLLKNVLKFIAPKGVITLKLKSANTEKIMILSRYRYRDPFFEAFF